MRRCPSSFFPCLTVYLPLPHLPEGSLAKHHQVVEVLSPDDVLPFHVMRNHRVLLDYFALVV